MMRSLGFAILVVGGTVAVGGCSDSMTGSIDVPAGALAMQYAEGGGYEASGAPVFSGSELSPGTFATAFPDSVGGLTITAFARTNGTRGDLFILQLGDRRKGTFSPCSMFDECRGRLLEDIDAQDLQDVARAWEITGGSVQVDMLGSDRVQGSFAGIVIQSQDGAAETRTVQNGTFDLPLLSEEEGVDIMQCFLARATGATSC